MHQGVDESANLPAARLSPVSKYCRSLHELHPVVLCQ